MACKHLGQKQTIIHELSGVVVQNNPICRLRRNPEYFVGFEWFNKCEEVSENDGCWLWNERNPNQPDIEFNRKR